MISGLLPAFDPDRLTGEGRRASKTRFEDGVAISVSPATTIFDRHPAHPRAHPSPHRGPILDDGEHYQGLRSANIKAKTDVTAVKLPGQTFLDLLQSAPGVALRIAVILAERLASDRRTLATDKESSRA